MVGMEHTDMVGMKVVGMEVESRCRYLQVDHMEVVDHMEEVGMSTDRMDNCVVVEAQSVQQGGIMLAGAVKVRHRYDDASEMSHLEKGLATRRNSRAR